MTVSLKQYSRNWMLVITITCTIVFLSVWINIKWICLILVLSLLTSPNSFLWQQFPTAKRKQLGFTWIFQPTSYLILIVVFLILCLLWNKSLLLKYYTIISTKHNCSYSLTNHPLLPVNKSKFNLFEVDLNMVRTEVLRTLSLKNSPVESDVIKMNLNAEIKTHPDNVFQLIYKNPWDYDYINHSIDSVALKKAYFNGELQNDTVCKNERQSHMHIYIIPHGFVDYKGQTTSLSHRVMEDTYVDGQGLIRSFACYTKPSIKTKTINFILSQTNGIELFYKSERKHSEIFVISQAWGTGGFHLMIENLPKIAPYLIFLKANPNIKIHILAKTTAACSFFRVLGIDSARLVSGPVKGDIIYKPRDTHCGCLQQPHGFLLRNYFHSYVQKALPVSSLIRNYIVVMKRSAKRWIKEENHLQIVDKLTEIAQKNNLKVVIFDDRNLPNLDDTMSMFYKALIVVAPHGAGLSNLIVSREKTLVIEVMCKIYNNLCYKHMLIPLSMHYHKLDSTAPSCDRMFVSVEIIQSLVESFLLQWQG